MTPPLSAARFLHRVKSLRPRYSVTALFALTTVISLILAVRVYQEQQYQLRVAAAMVLVDTVAVDAEIPDQKGRPCRMLQWHDEELQRNEVVFSIFARAYLTPPELAAVMRFPTLRVLKFHSAFHEKKEIDSQLAQISKLPMIEELDIHDTRLSDDGVRYLSRLRHLRVLNLSETEITGSGFDGFSALRSLEELDLHDTNIDDEAVRQLAELQSLRVLDLGRTKVSSASLEYLSSMVRLRTLKLHGNYFGAGALRGLPNLPELVQLTLGGTGIGDDDLDLVCRLKLLEDVDLSGCAISDAGLQRLSSLERLRSLLLCNVPSTSAAAVEDLKKARPGILVYRGP